MVKYEPPSLASRIFLPFYNGLKRPFKPKIIRLFAAVLFWIVAFGCMIICGNLATFRSPKTQKDTAMTVLPDLLFDVLPEHKIHPLPDVLLYVLLVSVVGRVVSHNDGICIARRFAAIAGCVYFFRSFTLIATSFPDPQLLCQEYTPKWNFSALTGTCGDMMGHTVNLALAALCWSQYTKYRLASVLVWLVAVGGMITLIVNRSHYTIDILISVFISVFVWKYYHMVLALPSTCQNRIVVWLEEQLDFETEGEEAGKDRDGLELPDLGGPGPSRYSSLSCKIKSNGL